MSEEEPYWKQTETIPNAIVRLANEGKRESEIFDLIVEKNRNNGLSDFEKPDQRNNLMHMIRAIISRNWFYTVDGPDEEELAAEKRLRKIQRGRSF
tara:strand:+ start:2447 stop:2734 length:288 start_codon:yes stop_codon:yes gene_type:complete